MAFSGERAGDCVQHGLVAVGRDNCCSGAGERLRGREADTGSGAGHLSDLVSKPYVAAEFSF